MDILIHAVNIKEIVERMMTGDTDIAEAGIVMDAVAGDDLSTPETPCMSQQKNWARRR